MQHKISWSTQPPCIRVCTTLRYTSSIHKLCGVILLVRLFKNNNRVYEIHKKTASRQPLFILWCTINTLVLLMFQVVELLRRTDKTVYQRVVIILYVVVSRSSYYYTGTGICVVVMRQRQTYLRDTEQMFLIFDFFKYPPTVKHFLRNTFLLLNHL